MARSASYLPLAMKIATFNANSIRVRLSIVVDWLLENDVDVLAIQETKCEDAKFPVEEIEDAGYQAIFDGQKSYNGVAILSRYPITDVQKGFPDPLMPDDKRILAATVNGYRIINTYVPNGNTVGSEKFAYKLKWLESFVPYLKSEIARNGDVLWMGDINIALHPEDVYDSVKVSGGVGHHPDEFSRLQSLIDLGLTDLFRKYESGGGHYTFWEFMIPRAVERGIGWRIDHIYATPGLSERCQSCLIDKGPRLLERPSDHTFVLAEFA